MKLATLDDGTKDGALVVVSRDLSRCVRASGIAESMLDALERWNDVEPRLIALFDAIQAGEADGTESFEPLRASAPLPRSWQWLDSSVYPSHSHLMETIAGLTPIPRTVPLMYQGLSYKFYNGTEDVPFGTEADDIDFEAEFGIITDTVPMGTSAVDARNHIRLVVQICDWSLRRQSFTEFKTGMGLIQSKPACSVAPVAVTPDELGDHWDAGRIALRMKVTWNDEVFGDVDSPEMEFGFDDLVAHAAGTRDLVAGTIIGSGTVSDWNYRDVGSCTIAERRGIEVVDHGAPITGFLKFGDRVRMEGLLPGDTPVFGVIDQAIVRA